MHSYECISNFEALAMALGYLVILGIVGGAMLGLIVLSGYGWSIIITHISRLLR